MSLLQLIEIPAIKELFSEFIAFPKGSIDRPLLAPPLTKRYGIIGTAFDYILRFQIERKNSNSIARTLVAENALYSLDFAIYLGDDKSKTKKVEKVVYEAKKHKLLFLSSGTISDELIKCSIQLASIEAAYRSRKVELIDKLDQTISTIDPDDVADIKKLSGLVDLGQFESKEICLLNPTFGEASVLVAGADADLIIDDLLIDIKTTKSEKISPEYIKQLIGYYILSRIGKIDGLDDRNHTIKRIGIYFSRFAYLAIFPLGEIIEESRQEQLVEAFKKIAKRVKWQE